jgi:hypothetical protein
MHDSRTATVLSREYVVQTTHARGTRVLNYAPSRPCQVVRARILARSAVRLSEAVALACRRVGSSDNTAERHSHGRATRITIQHRQHQH